MITKVPDVQALRCFVAGATRPSFRAAARSVALSPTAFSDRIKQLESLYGVRLFERTTRRVSLTPAGERLLEQAERCLSELSRCADVVASASQRPLHRIVLGTRYELGMSWIVPGLDALEAALPGRIDLHFADTVDLLPRLLRGEIDAMVTSARLTSSALAFGQLHEERYAFVASPRVLRPSKLDAARDATSHTLIDVHPDLPLFRYWLDARPEVETWRFQDQRFYGTIGAIKARVVSGHGVAVLPEYFIRSELARKRLVRVMPRARLRSDWFRLVWRTGQANVGVMLALADALRARPLR